MLRYLNYQKGHTGLSNSIMSMECGVCLSYLLDRPLIFSHDFPPPANGSRNIQPNHVNKISNNNLSKVTDLYNIPVPWMTDDQYDILYGDKELKSKKIVKEPLFSCVYYSPGTDLNSSDFISFANNRRPDNFFTNDSSADILEIDQLTLSFYSYLLYMSNDDKKRLHKDVLPKLQPRDCYREYAKKIADQIGEFNAAHVRLGDFRETFGVTTKLRTATDLNKMLVDNFDTSKTLVISTDESFNDEFFKPVLDTFDNVVFVDLQILDNDENRREFWDLPQHDNLCLAMLSQLVCGYSDDFIGTMTSTFTAMINRHRGNNNKTEDFKFLYNEIPDEGDKLHRGEHKLSETVKFVDNKLPLVNDGPYTWNKLDLWVGCEYYAWFREWPESFIKNG